MDFENNTQPAGQRINVKQSRAIKDKTSRAAVFMEICAYIAWSIGALAVLILQFSNKDLGFTLLGLPLVFIIGAPFLCMAEMFRNIQEIRNSLIKMDKKLNSH